MHHPNVPDTMLPCFGYPGTKSDMDDALDGLAEVGGGNLGCLFEVESEHIYLVETSLTSF